MSDPIVSSSPPLPDPEDDLPDADEFSLALKKKKKKKTVKIEGKEEENTAFNPAPVSVQAGPQEVGVLAAGEEERDYTYMELLERVFALLRDKNPNLTVRKRHVMPPPQLVRVGTRRTMWANFAQICQLMHRSIEHVMSFLLAELGTEGSIDGNQRLIIKDRFQPKQIESLLKKYIIEYVTCHMCRNPETTLTRDSLTRLYFIQCEFCQSTRSVAPIKSGFHATMRTDRRNNRQQ
jgi:translation initiation factor 2 subunit 2